MMEKVEYCSKNLADLADALSMRPRGRGGIRAVLTAPTSDDADYGYIWASCDLLGAKFFCGHGTLGLITTIVELGLVEVKEPVTEVKLDFPLGRVTGFAEVKDGLVQSLRAHLSWGAFNQESFNIDLPSVGKVPVDIGFAGRYSAFMRADDLGVKVRLENMPKIWALVKAAYPLIMSKVEELKIYHPIWKDMRWNGHTIIEDEPTLPEATHKNVTTGPRGGFDPSPCGSGTCGNMGVLYSKGKLKLNQRFVNENMMGTATFTARLTSETKVGDYEAATPEYGASGSSRAFITAMTTEIIDPRDPHKYGFKELRNPKLAPLFRR
jgi:proline racemase